MNAQRQMAAKVQRAASLMGLPDVVVARMYDSEAREAATEARHREAERQAALERHEDAVLAHRLSNAEHGLAPDTSVAERLTLLNPLSDGPGRDPGAAYGSASRPALFVSDSQGGMVDVGYESARQAQRSLSETCDDDLVTRAREMHSDSFMTIQLSRFRSRRTGSEAQRGEATRGRYEVTRVTSGAFV